MAFATASGSQMSDMNVTPLVDVMLVLLIIFMVTVPMVNYTNDINIAKSPPRAPCPSPCACTSAPATPTCSTASP